MSVFCFSWLFAALLMVGLTPIQAAKSFSPDPSEGGTGNVWQGAHVATQGGKRFFIPFAPRNTPSDASQRKSMKSARQKKASELIHSQDPPVVVPRVLSQATPQNVSIFIALLRQRIYLKVGDEIAVDAPLSSGKVAGMTPRGQFTILEKDLDHRSSIYGNFVNAQGEVVRAGVSLKIDAAPSGTTYVGAPMRWFMRLTWQGIGMHAGILPGYPASQGCIRLPEPIAKIIYDSVRIGTRVVIAD